MLQFWWSGEAGHLDLPVFCLQDERTGEETCPQSACTIGHRWPGTQAGLRRVPEFLIFVYRNNGQVFFNR